MKHKSVLLADADARARGEIRRGLETMGYPVFEAGAGESALQVLDKHDVGLVVMELYLKAAVDPCLLRFIRRTKALRRVKVLVLTDHSDAADQAWATREGADAYLVKPTRLDRILQVATQLASSRTPARCAARGGM